MNDFYSKQFVTTLYSIVWPLVRVPTCSLWILPPYPRHDGTDSSTLTTQQQDSRVENVRFPVWASDWVSKYKTTAYVCGWKFSQFHIKSERMLPWCQRYRHVILTCTSPATHFAFTQLLTTPHSDLMPVRSVDGQTCEYETIQTPTHTPAPHLPPLSITPSLPPSLSWCGFVSW